MVVSWKIRLADKRMALEAEKPEQRKKLHKQQQMCYGII